jgi:hypothetical protein
MFATEGRGTAYKLAYNSGPWSVSALPLTVSFMDGPARGPHEARGTGHLTGRILRDTLG